MKRTLNPVNIYVSAVNGMVRLTAWIPDKTRRSLVNLSVLIMLCIGTLQYCNKIIKGLLHYSDWVFAVSMAALVVFVIAGADRKVEINRVKTNRLFWLGWIVCFLFMLISSFTNTVKDAYFLWAISGVFLYPLIFLSWHHDDKLRKLFKTFTESAVLVAYLFIIASVIIVPFFSREKLSDGFGYFGMAANPNNNGMLVLTFYAASLYGLLTNKSRRLLYYLIPMGVSVGIAVIADCRTAELGILAQSVCGLLYSYVYAFRKGKGKIRLGRLAGSIILIIAIAVASGMLLNRLDYMDLSVYAEDGVESMGPLAEEVFELLDRLSTGRLSKTRYFIEHSTFWGNGSPDGPVMEGQPDSKWAFNNAVDILYISGVIPFIGCVMWVIAVLVFILKCLFGRGPKREAFMLTIVAFMGYFVEFMLETTMYPVTNHLAMLAYIALIPVTCTERQKQNDDQTCKEKSK